MSDGVVVAIDDQGAATELRDAEDQAQRSIPDAVTLAEFLYEHHRHGVQDRLSMTIPPWSAISPMEREWAIRNAESLLAAKSLLGDMQEAVSRSAKRSEVIAEMAAHVLAGEQDPIGPLLHMLLTRDEFAVADARAAAIRERKKVAIDKEDRNLDDDAGRDAP